MEISTSPRPSRRLWAASAAFFTRFRKIWISWSSSPQTGGSAYHFSQQTLQNLPQGNNTGLNDVLLAAAAFAALGTPKNGGTRLVCISGHVNKPGVYELPLGYPMLKSIYEVAGGIPGGKKLKAVVPGGSSCPLLKADECDIPMDYDTLAKVGSMLGSGGMVVMDESTDMVKVALRISRFYAHESCGWCIPCREGTTWLRKILQRFVDGGGRREDIALLRDLSQNMLGRTFCALGDAAAMPTISIVDKFPEDFERRLSLSAVA